MISSRLIRCLSVALLAIHWSGHVLGDEVKNFRTRPAGAVFNFLEAVDAGDPRYERYVDFGLFVKANRDRLTGCNAQKVRSYMRQLVMLPLRHRPAGAVPHFVEKTKYEVDERVEDYERATVSFVKATEGQSIQKMTFKLVAKADRWVIVELKGYFEEYLFQACAASASR